MMKGLGGLIAVVSTRVSLLKSTAARLVLVSEVDAWSPQLLVRRSTAAIYYGGLDAHRLQRVTCRVAGDRGNGHALRIVLELPSDVNFMIRKWLAARQRSGHTDSNNASRLSCFAQTPCGQRRKLSVSR